MEADGARLSGEGSISVRLPTPARPYSVRAEHRRHFKTDRSGFCRNLTALRKAALGPALARDVEANDVQPRVHAVVCPHGCLKSRAVRLSRPRRCLATGLKISCSINRKRRVSRVAASTDFRVSEPSQLRQRPFLHAFDYGSRHSEREKYTHAVNGRTQGENSEGPLILLVNSADFDSAIRRCDPPCVASHPVLF